MSKTTRDLLSQNFLWNRELVNRLIRGSSISQNDSVLEIGAGKGIITEELLGTCREITAIEADERLFTKLRDKLTHSQKISLVSGNFLRFSLPTKPFKVFSNIPFSITGEIIKKLLFSPNPPADSYLVVQNEAAENFVIRKGRNSMLAIIFYPFFDIKVVHNFKKTDFKPEPRVESCLIRLTKRRSSLISDSSLEPYRDYVVYKFTRDRSATSTSPQKWLNDFKTFMGGNDIRAQRKVDGSFGKWRNEEKKLAKIHRTRKDKNWLTLKKSLCKDISDRNPKRGNN